MSGGHFNYNEYAIDKIACQVAQCAGEFEHIEGSVNRDLKDKVIAYTLRLCNDLQRSYKAVKVLDYYVSGDTGEETFIEEMKTIYGDET